MLHSVAFFFRDSYSADVSNWSEPLIDNITDCTASLHGSYTIDLLALVTFAKLNMCTTKTNKAQLNLTRK